MYSYCHEGEFCKHIVVYKPLIFKLDPTKEM